MEKLLYGVEDRPPNLITTTLLSLQHLLAALGGIIAVPLVFGGALKLPADQIVALVNAALLGSGIVTIIQCRGVGPVGIRLPCVMGTSFAFVGAGISVGLEHGVPGILGSSLVGSLVMIIGSFFMPVIRRFFPHTVTSVVVIMIGLSLTPVAVDWAAGGVGSGNYGAVGNLAIAGFVLALVIAFVQWGKGIISASAVVLGIVCGYLLCLALGLIDFTQVREAPVFAIPQPLHFGMSFPVSGIVAMSIAFLVTIVETTGTFMALGAATQTPIRGKRLASGMLCDGVGSAFAAVMSSPPVSTFAQNVGVVSLTGVASRHVVMLTGVMLLAAGLFPVLGALVVTIPLPVLGGAGLMMFATIIAAGIRMLGGSADSRRSNLIIAVSLGCGLAVTVRPDLLSKMPAFVREVFGSGITVGALVAVGLNLLLPGREVEAPEEDMDAVATPLPVTSVAT
ncbi:nucleobase:cation symporter-2 family protein [Comamonas resistens]|uniref:Nucleobase:cation symporter-2 family protein n=1 Tax=Comamonas resistens TaxID=3046670 RepID=A0ABY8SQF2_9BURK|nr:nucleobase:cation symporter-2 family protein [Comamonas resistens]MDL5036364.1 nucleobase:cation symporter-2 family protein [Comamonas resistens]WHS64711.1 nucleobase:cation symporter-2 family protein [Comamonas resistens]